MNLEVLYYHIFFWKGCDTNAIYYIAACILSQCPEMANYAPPICFPLFLANIVLNSKLCCCVAGEHNSGFDPPENMFFMCNRGGNVQKTTFWRFWSKNCFLTFLGLFWLFFPQKFAKKHGEPLFRLLPTLPCLNFDLKWFLSDFMIRTNLKVSLF